MKRTILVFGSASLVGSDFTARAVEHFEVVAVGRTDPRSLGLEVARFDRLDLADEKALRAYLSVRKGDAAWVNFAARTDVDGCEAERPEDPDHPLKQGVSRPDSAWRMNAEVPAWIAEASERAGTPFLHISTDFVFDGTKGPYAETKEPSPFGPRMSWYGFTKGIGERAIRWTGNASSIVRISYPYRGSFPAKTDFARNLLDRARSGELFPLYSDQRITPTWIPDVTDALLALIEKGGAGVLHVASPVATTPLEFARCLLEEFEVDAGPLAATRLASQTLPPGRAPRPVLGGLVVRRAKDLGLDPLPFREGIRRMAVTDRAPS